MCDQPAVELRGVSKVYAGGVKAVDEVSLRISAQRVTALLGPSGCGKTTTLRLINRLEEATTGEVFVRGRNVRDFRPELLRRSIGYIIQEGGLLPHLDVTANVGMVTRLLQWPPERTRARVAEVLEQVGLPQAHFGQRMPAQLSGGQRQRVGVARALAADPDLLLMDEPFGALDPGTRESIQDEFLRLNAELRKTVVIVTHDIAEAGRLADEIVLLDRGRIVQRGDMRALLVRPDDARVNAFLGRRVPELILSVLRLEHLLHELPRTLGPMEPAVRLAAELPLAQVLASLAHVPDDAAVAVDGAPGGTYTARDLRARIRADLTAGSAAATTSG
jgi:osmoprotectant transport system ATP-binding protein